MDSLAEDWNPTFWIGQHDSKRIRVTPDLLEQAHACNVRSKSVSRAWEETNQLSV